MINTGGFTIKPGGFTWFIQLKKVRVAPVLLSTPISTPEGTDQLLNQVSEDQLRDGSPGSLILAELGTVGLKINHYISS